MDTISENNTYPQQLVDDKALNNITPTNEQEMLPEIKNKTPNNRKLILFITLLLILILGIGIFFYIKISNQKDQSSKYIQEQLATMRAKKPITPTPFPMIIATPYPTSSPLSETGEHRIVTASEAAKIRKEVSEAKWKTLTSKLVGISFEYPSEWGEVDEKIEDNDNPGNSGKIYSLFFPSYPKLNGNFGWGSGVSKDFSAPRSGSLGTYRGSESNQPTVKSYLDIQDPGCFTMGSRNSFDGLVDFNLNGKDVGGVRLMIPILSQTQREEIDTLFNLNKVNCETTEGENQAKALGKDIIKYIEEDNKIDEESYRNLITFKRIAQSAKLD